MSSTSSLSRLRSNDSFPILIQILYVAHSSYSTIVTRYVNNEYRCRQKKHLLEIRTIRRTKLELLLAQTFYSQFTLTPTERNRKRRIRADSFQEYANTKFAQSIVVACSCLWRYLIVLNCCCCCLFVSIRTKPQLI